MKKKFSVSVVIPNYNGQELLKRNLPSIIKALEFSKNNIKEIIIVDDKSKDGSVQLIKEDFPKIKLILHSKNRGFSVSVNTGVRYAKSELVCILNSDVSVTPNFLQGISYFFENQSTFAVSLHEKGYGPAAGKFIDGFIVHEGMRELDKSVPTFWVNGGTGVFSRKLWFKIGGLDDKVFTPYYWEDLDISYRALKTGYQIYWSAGNLVFHEHEATMRKIKYKKRVRIQERNQLLLIWKNLTSSRLIRKHILGLVRRIVGHPGYLNILFLALIKLPLVLKSRKKVKKLFKVSDEAIFASFR